MQKIPAPVIKLLFCILFPAIGLPGLVLLCEWRDWDAAGLLFTMMYIIPGKIVLLPFDSVGYFHNPFFEGMINIRPTLVLGYLLCSTTWAVFGLLFWRLFVYQKKPVQIVNVPGNDISESAIVSDCDPISPEDPS